MKRAKLSLKITSAMAVGVATVLFTAPVASQAVVVPVANHSFEINDLASGTNDNVAPPSWSVTGGSASYLDRNSGIFNTRIDPTPDAADSEQAAWSNGGDLYQVLGTNLAANTEYTLTVDVGDRTDHGAPAQAIRLGTGAGFGTNLLGAPFSMVSDKTPVNGGGANDGWETWTTTFNTGAGVVGDALRVELVSGGVQPLFDNVRIESNAVDNFALEVGLQNATADFSQNGFVVGSTIDGNLSTTSSGWAFHNQLGVAHTAVYETTSDIDLSELTLGVLQRRSFELKKLRFSVTQDDRSLFADGLSSGGDVIANWTVLDPLTASGVINGDGSINFANNGVNLDTITAIAPFGGITGVRVEVLTDGGSVGYNGGNAVFAEFQVLSRALSDNAVPEPATATLALLGLGGLMMRRRRNA